jgi:uncharacterized membrane protein
MWRGVEISSSSSHFVTQFPNIANKVAHILQPNNLEGKHVRTRMHIGVQIIIVVTIICQG